MRVSKDGDLHPGNSSSTPQGKANGFFAEYGGLFGVKNADTELALLSTFTDSNGATHMSYQQIYKGVPVFAAILQAHVDANNSAHRHERRFRPRYRRQYLSGFQRRSSRRASDRRCDGESATERINRSRVRPFCGLSASAPTLYVYRDGLIQDVQGPNYLVYEVAGDQWQQRT